MYPELKFSMILKNITHGAKSILHDLKAYHMVMWYVFTYYMTQTKCSWYATNHGLTNMKGSMLVILVL